MYVVLMIILFIIIFLFIHHFQDKNNINYRPVTLNNIVDLPIEEKRIYFELISLLQIRLFTFTQHEMGEYNIDTNSNELINLCKNGYVDKNEHAEYSINHEKLEQFLMIYDQKVKSNLNRVHRCIFFNEQRLKNEKQYKNDLQEILLTEGEKVSSFAINRFFLYCVREDLP